MSHIFLCDVEHGRKSLPRHRWGAAAKALDARGWWKDAARRAIP